MHRNGKILISATRALRFWCAASTAFRAAQVGVSTIASLQPHVVPLLSCRTTVAIALGQREESLGSLARMVLSQSLVPRAPIRRDATIQPPLQKLPLALGRIG